MATSVIQYNVSTITRHPLHPSSSSSHHYGGDLVVPLTTHNHLIVDSGSNDNHHHHHRHQFNNATDDSANSFPNNHYPTAPFPSWLDPSDYGAHAEFFHYEGDVHHLALPWVREPNFLPLVAVHALTFALGIAGNVLVISVLCCGRPGRCVTFPCLLSMATADVLFLAVCVPHELVGYFLTHWGLSSFLCKLSGFVEMLCALAAVLNLILISLERYFVIAHPLMSKSLCTTRKAKIALVLTWIAAFVLSTPAFVVMDTEVNVYYNNNSVAAVSMCGDFGMRGAGRLAWAAWQLALLFVLPALLLLFCYTRVIVILWLSTRQLQTMTGSRYSSTAFSSSRNGPRGEVSSSSGWKSSSGADRSLLATSASSSASHPPHSSSSAVCRNPGEEALQARRQVIRMLVVIMVVFLVCWGPHLTINMLKRLEVNVYTHGSYHVWVMFACLPYIQSVINPVIYVLMSKKIRDSICTTPCVRCLLARSCRCCARGPHVKQSTTHELLTATNQSVAGTGMKTSLETMRSYGASELTDV
ncbi:allatostatin-A receptor-like [Babylonia areolata]|uniref:allatostatin-A receptor-like n=1 Tax=Babylonia areolata TaxID=304850 RepID=UPI003FD666B4